MSKKKNVFDYISMGLKSQSTIKKEQAEKRQKAINEATEFNKAFTDKTYTVAKKVIDNVEKVADYDFEAFFSRVNNQIAPHRKQLDPEEREKRSKEFEEKVKSHPDRFNINEYMEGQEDYKNNIIEKTKKNIQKKKVEAENRQHFSDGIINENDKLGQTKEDIETKIVENVQAGTVETEVAIEPEKAIEIEKVIEPEKAIEPEEAIEAEEIIELEEAMEAEECVEVHLTDHEDGSTLEESSVYQEESSNRVEDFLNTEETAEETGKGKEKIVSKYSKDDLHRSNRYYRKQKKDKFAKKMKVELDDNLIVKKQRSIRRLFKFSISFKLSFVFIILMIIAVVSLSIAFYVGIDYVLGLQASGHMDDVQYFKDILLILLIIFNFVTILLGISIGTKTSRELVRPIDEMTQIVQQINAKEMDRRLNVKGMHDELKELAMTFNEMLDRIENSYETQNRFTSDASHELRTPIAVIQGYINMLDRWGKADGEILDESIEAIKSESHNMKRLTEKLLLLAKADKGILELEFEPFNLDELIREISRETLMIDSNHTIKNEINDVKMIIADRESLKQAIRIFVDNAVKYTPEGGHISINSYINRNKIFIEIKDDGIGISKEDMDNIFNRFYRVDKSRAKESGGHGLGLSIAKWIVSQHKGEIEVKSELNKGTIITLILSPMTQ